MSPTEAVEQYSAIRIQPSSAFQRYTLIMADFEGEPADAIRGLNHINLFVGPNNCGKSRLIRELFKLRPYEFDSSHLTAPILREKIIELHTLIIELFHRSGTLHTIGNTNQISKDILGSYLDWPFLTHQYDAQKYPKSGKFGGLQEVLLFISGCQANRREYPGLELIKEKALQIYTGLQSIPMTIGQEPHCYIPILRSLRKIKSDTAAGDFLYTRTCQDYSMSGTSTVFGDQVIFTGQELYAIMRGCLLGEEDERKQHEAYEKFLSQNFFDNNPVILIPREIPTHGQVTNKQYKEPHYYDMVWIKVGDEDERPVCDLGDGLQTIILMTYLPFTREARTLFFIEEPDAFLHPGMQRKLLAILSTHDAFQKHQFFMTTHSNHLLDMTLDFQNISTYLVKPQTDKAEVKLVTRTDRVILAELGAHSSSVFLTNAAIWVEGITDRRYIREFLKKYFENNTGENWQEDTHYSFLEFGGSCVTHLNFAEQVDSAIEENGGPLVRRICADSFIVLDGDNFGKGTRISDLQTQLGREHVHVLDCKEIENCLPENIVRATALKMIESSRRTDKVAILKKLESYQLNGNPIGQSLDAHLGIDYFSESTGTLTQKTRFCERAIETMAQPDWELTEHARTLCTAIVNFIKLKNPTHP